MKLVSNSHSKVREALKELQALLKEVAPADAVAIDIRITSQGVTMTSEHRDAESLLRDGISMRNIAGEFILPEQEED